MTPGLRQPTFARALAALGMACGSLFLFAGCGGGGGDPATGAPTATAAPTAGSSAAPLLATPSGTRVADLTVLRTTPAAGVANVPTGTSIGITFSEPLAGMPAMRVATAGGPVPGTLAYTGSTLTFTSTAALPLGTRVSVDVPEATGVSGARLAAPHAFAFTTQALAAAVTVRGTAEYESVPTDPGTGGLDYAAATFKPIRSATVHLVEAASGATLASAVTDLQGRFSLQADLNAQQVFVRVRAESVRTGSTGGQWHHTVRDNTRDGSLYVLDGSAFAARPGTVTANLRAASGWTSQGYRDVRAAAPFAILDVAHEATRKVLGVEPDLVFPPLRLFWSAGNRPVSGDRAAGEIGSSSHHEDVQGHRIDLLGAEDSDTDEYDRMVIAHEFGHYLQAAFSRDDTIGGAHGETDRLDMRVAFSEGFGNAWAGMLFRTPLYADSLGPAQAGGFVRNLADAPSNGGWFSTDTVQFLLYAWHADPGIGFASLWRVLRDFNDNLTRHGAVSSLHAFAHALKQRLPVQAAAIDDALTRQGVTVADALGTGERNDGGIASSLPVYRTHDPGSPRRVCVTDQAGPADEAFNKLGSHAFVRFRVDRPGRHTLSVTGEHADSDPDFSLVQPDGKAVAFQSGVARSEVVTATLGAGWHVMSVYDYDLLFGAGKRSTAGERCFTVSIQ